MQLGDELVALVPRRRPKERRKDDLFFTGKRNLDGCRDDAERVALADGRDRREGHDLARLVAENVGVEAQRALQDVQPAVEEDAALVGAGEVSEDLLVGVLKAEEHFDEHVLRVLLRAARVA